MTSEAINKLIEAVRSFLFYGASKNSKDDMIDGLQDALDEYDDSQVDPYQDPDDLFVNDDKTEHYISNGFGHCFYIEYGDQIAIYSLYVDRLYRGKKHATGLLERAIYEIRRSGYTGDIVIEAIPGDSSVDKEELVRFYERMGLVVLPERDKG